MAPSTTATAFALCSPTFAQSGPTHRNAASQALPPLNRPQLQTSFISLGKPTRPRASNLRVVSNRSIPAPCVLQPSMTVTSSPPTVLPDTTVEVVKATVPVLKKRGTEIAFEFYNIMFQRYPELKKQFNTDRQRGGVTAEGGLPAQIVALTTAVMAFAKNVDNVSVLLPAVERIGHKHVSRGVTAVQYEKISECFLSAMEIILAESATDELMAAWTEAFAFLSEIFVQAEKRIKEDLERKAGYSGFVMMDVLDIVEDGEGGKKLSLAPEEFKIPSHNAGQFVSILIEKEGEQASMTSMRIFDSDKESLWISVPKSMEKTSLYLLNDVQVGSALKVSVPYGSL